MLMLLVLLISRKAMGDDSYVSHSPQVACTEQYIPDNCNYPNTTLDDIKTVEDLERCAPALLPIPTRNYYWGGAGRKTTFDHNFEGLKSIYITPQILRDVSNGKITTKLLGVNVNLPVGISPTAAHKRAHPDGELATAKAAASHGALMVLSSMAESSIEDVASAAFSINENAVLWMQTYIYKNRQETLQIVKRAEEAGFKAIVVTIDAPVGSSFSCNPSDVLRNLKFPNLLNQSFAAEKFDSSLTFKDLKWLVDSTSLPIVAKGVTTGNDAISVAETGVKAIYVSNQGGRQVDGERSAVESLRDVVAALRTTYPTIEIYMDGGVRNGWDVLKVLSVGAHAAFVGRPTLWGLAINGQNGVSKMLEIFKSEFEKAMFMSGYSSPDEVLAKNRQRIKLNLFYK